MKAYRNTADFILIIAAIVILAGALAFFTGNAGAKQQSKFIDYSDVGCTPYTRGMVLHGQSAAMTHSPCGTPAQDKEREQDTQDTNTPAIVDAPVTPEPPAVEPPVIVPTQEPPVVTPPVITPEVPSTPEPSNAGNPGNTKDVGNAGENPNGRGTMDNDNAGGNGNGEHGNQGEGGHG
jgi:hypothetical protein